MINLDKLVSNFEIEVSDIVVHTEKMEEIAQGHFPQHILSVGILIMSR